MSKRDEENIERFFRKAASQYDADIGFRDEDWSRMEKMLDDETTRIATIKSRRWKIGGVGAGIVIILALLYFLTTNEQPSQATNGKSINGNENTISSDKIENSTENSNINNDTHHTQGDDDENNGQLNRDNSITENKINNNNTQSESVEKGLNGNENGAKESELGVNASGAIAKQNATERSSTNKKESNSTKGTSTAEGNSPSTTRSESSGLNSPTAQKQGQVDPQGKNSNKTQLRRETNDNENLQDEKTPGNQQLNAASEQNSNAKNNQVASRQGVKKDGQINSSGVNSKNNDLHRAGTEQTTTGDDSSNATNKVNKANTDNNSRSIAEGENILFKNKQLDNSAAGLNSGNNDIRANQEQLARNENKNLINDGQSNLSKSGKDSNAADSELAIKNNTGVKGNKNSTDRTKGEQPSSVVENNVNTDGSTQRKEGILNSANTTETKTQIEGKLVISSNESNTNKPASTKIEAGTNLNDTNASTNKEESESGINKTEKGSGVNTSGTRDDRDANSKAGALDQNGKEIKSVAVDNRNGDIVNNSTGVENNAHVGAGKNNTKDNKNTSSAEDQTTKNKITNEIDGPALPYDSVKREEELIKSDEKNQDEPKAEDSPILRDKNWPTSTWSFALVVAPDFSSTGLKNYTKPGSAFGLTVQYQLSRKLAIFSGLISTKKIYWGYGNEYTPPVKDYWMLKANGIKPFRINGTCMVLEVPLSVRYNLMEVEKNLLYMSAGISSYLMQSQNYEYLYAEENPGAVKEWDSEKNAPGQKFNYYFKIGIFSIGYERLIAPNWSVAFEPYFKTPFAGVGWPKVKLYTTGAYVTLRYRLLKKKKSSSMDVLNPR